jgi:hypothetical protein
MNEYYYRKVRGVWHILVWQRGGSEFRALCGESTVDANEGYAALPGHRRDPKDACPLCVLRADGARQLGLLEVQA